MSWILDRYLGETRLSEALNTMRNLRRNRRENTNTDLIGISDWEQYYKRVLTEERIDFTTQLRHKNEQNIKPIKPITI